MSEELIDSLFHFGWDMFSGEVIMSLIVMGIIALLSFVIYFAFRKADPLKPDRGFVMIVETLVEKLENFTEEMMGKKWRSFAGYILGLGAYLAFSFLVSLMGFPGPFTYLGNTVSIALCTFLLIHITAIRKNKLRYFKRYVDPIPVLLPVKMLSDAIFGSFVVSGVSSILLPPLITPVLHAYFDVFSGAIQTLIFVMLTMMFISQEDPDEGDEIGNALSVQKGKA